MKHALRLAIAQINPVVGDLDGNVRKIIAGMAQAREVKADLVLFPEQVIPGYPAEDLVLKKQFVKDNLRALDKVRAASKGLTAIVGFIDSHKGLSYNAAAVLSHTKHCATYRKMYLPNYGVFDEKRIFASGDSPLLLEHKGAILGLNICEDIWVEHGPSDSAAQAGAQLVMNISASPYHLRKGKERESLLMRRAKSRRVWIAYANMVGGQDEILFDGQSVIVSPQGQIVSRAQAFVEEMIVADIPLGSTTRARDASKKSAIVRFHDVSSHVRKSITPILHKHREEVEEILQALILGTRDYAHKNGFEKAVLGLSGGVDSALVAAIAAEALGPANVITVFMPSRFSSLQSLEDAQALAKNLNLRLEITAIDTVQESYLTQLKPYFKGLPSNIAEENLQARIRGNFLMALSNKFGWLVLTTGNKSETSVGYCTLYGDMAGGFAVIKDLFKDRVYRLARHINARAHREIIPQSILTKEPTAELRPQQKDSDSIPPYPQLDPILKGYVEENLGANDLIQKGFNAALVRRVVQLVDSNEYKRRQAPPGIKITPLAFGKDRRYPITNRYR